MSEHMSRAVSLELNSCCVLCQADWERSRKELDKARHDVERLRRALDRSDVEKRDQQQKGAATRQALEVLHPQNDDKLVYCDCFTFFPPTRAGE